MKFADIELHPDLRRGIEEVGFEECTPVQDETFKHTLAGNDVAVQSQTGTGKTAAFLITIFQLLSEDERFKGRQAYIVAPTRELAVQIEREAQRLGAHLSLRIANFYGGVGYGPQEKALKEGVDIIIGTPGRLLDFHRSKKLPFDNIGIVVIDEADRLFDMGFYPDIRRMMQDMRPREERLTMLFSATLSTKVRNIAWQYMNDPAEVDIEAERLTVDTVEQELHHVARREKLSAVLGLLERYQPENGLIFTNTKQAAEEVALRLRYNGFSAQFIMGDLPQKKRMQLIDGMKNGDVRFLVATDVAARGLHVDNLDIVINYDIPEDPENYVHRIGRTARAGQSGRAVALACERYVYGLEAIERLIDMKIPVGQLSDEDFKMDGSSRLSLGQVRKELGVRREKAPVSGQSRAGQTRGGESRSSASRSAQNRASQSRSSQGRSSRKGGAEAGSPAKSGAHKHGASDGDRRPAAATATGGEASGKATDNKNAGEGGAASGGNGGARAAGKGGGADNEGAREAGNSAARAGGSAQGSSKESPRREKQHPQAHHKPTRQPRSAPARSAKPSKKTSVEDRLEYYRRKYGEDFELAGSTGSSASKRSHGSSGSGPAENTGGAKGGGTDEGGGAATGSADTKDSGGSGRAGRGGKVWRRLSRIFGGSGEGSSE
ncbi:MAG: DEAD/DEAH box helicase [Spirochaetia bacterium]